MTLFLPSEGPFQSRKELLEYAQSFSVSHGYAVVIQKSNIPRGQVWLRCDYGNTRKRIPTTKKKKIEGGGKTLNYQVECPFQLYGRRLQDTSWHLKVQNGYHNHELAKSSHEMIAHPIARRFTLEQKRMIENMTENGAKPALIMETFKQKFPHKPIKIQDIYNIRNFIRREKNAGRTPFTENNESSTMETSSSSIEQQQFTQASENRNNKSYAARSNAYSISNEQKLTDLLNDIKKHFTTWSSNQQNNFLLQLESFTSTFYHSHQREEEQNQLLGMLGEPLDLDSVPEPSSTIPPPPLSPPPPPPPPPPTSTPPL